MAVGFRYLTQTWVGTFLISPDAAVVEKVVSEEVDGLLEKKEDLIEENDTLRAEVEDLEEELAQRREEEKREQDATRRLFRRE